MLLTGVFFLLALENTLALVVAFLLRSSLLNRSKKSAAEILNRFVHKIVGKIHTAHTVLYVLHVLLIELKIITYFYLVQTVIHIDMIP